MKKVLYAVYDEEDNIATICESVKELCKFFKKDPESMYCSISRNIKNKIKYVINKNDGKKYKIYKIKE